MIKKMKLKLKTDISKNCDICGQSRRIPKTVILVDHFSHIWASLDICMVCEKKIMNVIDEEIKKRFIKPIKIVKSLRTGRVHEYFTAGRVGGIGLIILPYQFAIGVSIRKWCFPTSIAFRLYIGPFKFWGYIKI